MQRSNQQNKSLHLGCQQIANVLVENGVSLNLIIKDLEIRPTMHSVKDIFRAIAKAKYGTESTADLETNQIDSVWEDLIKRVSETTGVFIPFPSEENRAEALQSYEQYL